MASDSIARLGRCGDVDLKFCMRPSFGFPAGKGGIVDWCCIIPGRMVLSCSSSDRFSNPAATARLPWEDDPVFRDSLGTLLDPAVVAEEAAAPSSLLEEGVCAPELLPLPDGVVVEAFKGISRRGPGLRGREGGGMNADMLSMLHAQLIRMVGRSSSGKQT